MLHLSSEQLNGFECKQCGVCCKIKNGIVRLDENSIAQISKHLGLNEEDFINNHTELSQDRRCLILKNTTDGSCEMLSDNGLCKIYEARPAQCRSFPFLWVNEDSLETCEGLKRI